MKRTKFTTTTYPLTQNKMSKTQYGFQQLFVYPVYTCLVNQVKPSETAKEQAPPYNLIEMEVEEIDIETESVHVVENMERSKAEYKIDVINSAEKESEHNITERFSNEDQEEINLNDVELSFLLHDNRNILKLTRMKWLTDNEDTDKNSSSSDNHTNSKTSIGCKEIVPMAHQKKLICDKHLSTILKLDKEHNLFGLANITISDTTPRTNTENSDKPLFPQSTIVLTCCGMGCCRHRSKTDLPVSLKCGSCGSCGGCPTCPPRPGCPSCGGPCRKPSIHPPPPRCPTSSPSCPAPALKPGVPPCSKPLMLPCAPLSCGSKCCYPDCAACRGFKMVLNKQPKYEPTPVEIASRAPSILHQPAAARKCSHTPRCQPPSSCFPYLMPCYWPALESAPCSHPERCFHHPACPPPRRNECSNTRTCPSPKCASAAKCPNPSCPSKNPEAQKIYGSESHDKESEKKETAAPPKKVEPKKGKK